MSEIGIEDVCRVFIKEKLLQKKHSGRRPPVGKNTEKKMRKFKASPLSIVLYPDMRPDALAEDHRKVINGLFASKLVSREELNTLRDCFFILTNIGWKGGLEKRTRTVSSFPPNDLDSVVDENQLLRNGDINRAEWERLRSYLNTQASL